MSKFLSKLRFARTNLQRSKNLDTGYVYVLVFGSRSERLSESTTTHAGVGIKTNIFSQSCSPTLWDSFGQVGLGQLGLNIGWDRWDWDKGVFRLDGAGWDWDRGVFRLGGTRWDCDRSLFDLSLSQWDRFGTGSVTVPCACTTWYLIKNQFQKLAFLIKNRAQKSVLIIKNWS